MKDWIDCRLNKHSVVYDSCYLVILPTTFIVLVNFEENKPYTNENGRYLFPLSPFFLNL